MVVCRFFSCNVHLKKTKKERKLCVKTISSKYNLTIIHQMSFYPLICHCITEGQRKLWLLNVISEHIFSKLVFENSKTLKVFCEGFDLQGKYNVKLDPYFVRLAEPNIYF